MFRSVPRNPPARPGASPDSAAAYTLFSPSSSPSPRGVYVQGDTRPLPPARSPANSMLRLYGTRQTVYSEMILKREERMSFNCLITILIPMLYVDISIVAHNRRVLQTTSVVEMFLNLLNEKKKIRFSQKI